ncbi:Gfo/Idh/MocA family protein [Paraburkholderia sp. DHOC27]|uniref:Gfo/Idh/MocA family protein n=1 Tax=Paraburkholderia sp. DHOC27 TaxID=2303330 RepID=UPI000E3DE34A|nr:Gfo/Idh/MocA family oxidoreductase [Paraburkholderia sp. DHOC27]RFU49230.1 gfo/Idh/MocA family oxidoreductase [Paraburkholderia sp. DHOC27]
MTSASQHKLRVAVVGCGYISDIYLTNLVKFAAVEVCAVADLDMERARASAQRHGVARVVTTDAVYDDAGIDLILNLTQPAQHAEVARRALQSGKHVYNEKPLTLDLGEARGLLETARSAGLKICCAPDTVLGAGIQTCRQLIDSGAIGEPIAATAFMTNHGHERWHPDPAFYYQPGAGPMFDMGPYYLSALVNLIGPIDSVSAFARASFPERVIGSKPKRGERIQVNTPTHVAGQMQFDNGAIGTIVTSFDIWGAKLPFIEVHGTEGSLSVPDPNTFGGPVSLKVRDGDWTDVPLSHPYHENTRGLGIADLAQALQSGAQPRTDGEIGYHVLEVMHGFLAAATRRQTVSIESTFQRPAPMSEQPLTMNSEGITHA